MIALTVIGLLSVFARETVKVTVPPAVTNAGLTVFAIDGAAAPHALTVTELRTPMAFGKLFAAPPVKMLTSACDANWLHVMLPLASVALTASRYWPRVSVPVFQVAVHLLTGSADGLPAAAIVQLLPASLAMPSALVSA